MSPIVVGVLVGILILSFLVSRYVATSLRMPDHGWKAGLIAFLIGISALIVYFEGPPKQGVDLKGGTILVYEVDEDATKRIMGDGEEDAGSGVSEDMMKGLVRSLSMRINPGGVQETVIRQYGAKQIEIVIPNVGDQEIERIKEVITKSGFLEFLIVANRRDHQDVIELADEKPGAYEIKDKSGRVVGRWVGVAVDYVDENGVPQYKVDVTGEKTREVRGNLEVLMYVDSLYDLDGEQIRSVRKGMDQRMRPAIFFNLDARGSQNMAGLTEKNKPNSTTGFKARLGIVMDNELISAPSINSVIVDSGTIEGNFSDEEVQSLVEILNAGSLPAILKTDPISESTVNPLLGADTIRQGKLAIGVSLAGVLVFMLIYYRFAGVVASAALLLNLLFILAAMIFLNAAFSLPGLAGLVLTVGMSVDANVLIFERIREERQNGGALRMAIRNGFARAMPTILDANVTNLITALVLYGIGGERLQGYAVTLILGILMCLFTAIFCSRLVFEIGERQRWIKDLSMMQVLSRANFNVFGKRSLALVFSAVLIVVGIGAAFSRGSKMFDIDLAGGNSVQVKLTEPMPIEDVRTMIDGLADDLWVTGIQAENENNRIYQIDTSIKSGEAELTVDSVKSGLMTRFVKAGTSLLETHKLDFTPPKPVQVDGANGAGTTSSTESASSEAEVNSNFDLTGQANDTETTTSDSVDQTDETVNESQPSTTEADGSADTSGDAASDVSEEADSVEAAEDSAESDVGQPEPSDQSMSLPANSLWAVFGQTNVTRLESTLTFDEDINEATLRQSIEDAVSGLGYELTDIEIANDQWDGNSSARYKEWTVRMPISESELNQVLGKLKTDLEGSPVWMKADTVGGQIAKDKAYQAVTAAVFSLLGIIVYLWVRFHRIVYGLAAVAALVHDVLVTIGVLALTHYLYKPLGFLLINEFKISLPVVAALLTIIGYSLNDTIVLFDRIREVKGKSPRLTSSMINQSINQTLSRTILTSVTTLIVVIILYVLGGQGVHAFAFCLIVGVLVGTYSSIFIASPVLLWLSDHFDVPEPKREKAVANSAS